MREAKEEIGVDISEGDLCVGHMLQRDSHTKENNERVELFFIAEKWQGEPKILEPNKCDGLEWFNQSNLPETVLPYIRHVVEMMNRGVVYSEYEWGEGEK